MHFELPFVFSISRAFSKDINKSANDSSGELRRCIWKGQRVGWGWNGDLVGMQPHIQRIEALMGTPI